MLNPDKFEKEFGVSLETFYEALKYGIWSKEKLTLPSKYCRQQYRYGVMPCYEKKEGEWYFYYKPNGCADGYVFWERVRVRDIGVTWSTTRKDLLEEKQIINEEVLMELERKVYNSWAFTENEHEKAKINREIYQELCSKYKVLKVGRDAWGKTNEPFSTPTPEEMANNDFVYARMACYGRAEYKIYKCPNELTLDEIALICDEGRLCFGYAEYKATRTNIEVSED